MARRRAGFDKGTQERWQHGTQQIKLMEEGQVMVACTMEESFLDILFLNKVITRLEREAAFRFRVDFMAADMTPHTTSSYNPMGRCNSTFYDEPERSEEEERAYQKWREAMAAMTGAVNGVVESVVCYEQIPPPEKVAFLRVGLKKLITFYGIGGVDGFAS